MTVLSELKSQTSDLAGMANATSERGSGVIAVFLTLLILPGASVLQAAPLPEQLGWYAIPNTKIDTVSACGVPYGSGPFPQVCGAEGTPAILSWSGGAYDSLRNRLIVHGGGHNAYYGNEFYSVDLDDLAVTRLNDPGLPIANSKVN